jgi:hypothetical protein
VISAAIAVGDRKQIGAFIESEAHKVGIQEDVQEGQFAVWIRWMRSAVRVGEIETNGFGRLLYEFGDDIEIEPTE